MKTMEDKKAFRHWAKTRIHKRARYRIKDRHIIAARLEKLIKLYNPKSILFYLPMSHEVDIKALMLQERKKRKIYVPFMVGNSFKMVRYRLPLKKAAFGILQAGQSLEKITQVDMIIVPILGVDGTYRRIGFGKGMYDRFYETLKKKPLTIFVQTIFCHTPRAITNDYDIQANYIVTPKDFLFIRA